MHPIEIPYKRIKKLIDMPSQNDLERTLQKGHEHAKKKGIKKDDVMKAVKDLRRAKEAIEKVAGRVEGFRTPAAWINFDSVT